MSQDPLSIIVLYIGDFYLYLLLLRFFSQLVEADYYNPLVKSILRFTRLPLAPFKVILPTFGNVDLAVLALAFVIKTTSLVLLFSLNDQMLPIASLAMASFVMLLDSVLSLYFWLLLGFVVLSWLAPGQRHPGVKLVEQLVSPLLNQVHKIIPPIGGLDLSPIIIFLGIQILRSQLNILF